MDPNRPTRLKALNPRHPERVLDSQLCPSPTGCGYGLLAREPRGVQGMGAVDVERADRIEGVLDAPPISWPEDY